MSVSIDFLLRVPAMLKWLNPTNIVFIKILFMRTLGILNLLFLIEMLKLYHKKYLSKYFLVDRYDVCAFMIKNNKKMINCSIIIIIKDMNNSFKEKEKSRECFLLLINIVTLAIIPK